MYLMYLIDNKRCKIVIIIVLFVFYNYILFFKRQNLLFLLRITLKNKIKVQ